jgi:HK97 gp10 family phage protein
MADGFSFDIKGLDDVDKLLENMCTKAADKCIRKALRAGAEIERAAITERAPIKDSTGGSLPEGALKSDIVIRMTRDEAGDMAAIIGPGKLTRHVANWVEWGHRMVTGGHSRLLANGKTKGPGKANGTVPAHPFIRVAYEATRQEVADAITTTLATEVSKVAKNRGRS